MYRNSLTHQQGSMLVIALFVIIVLAMLGATMSKMVIASNVTLVTDLTGLRAKHGSTNWTRGIRQPIFSVR